MQKKKWAFNRSMALKLVDLVDQIETNGIDPVLKALEDIEKQSGIKRGTWGYYANKFKSICYNHLHLIIFIFLNPEIIRKFNLIKELCEIIFF